MTVWEELKARGLIAQVTGREDEIKEMVNNGKATFISALTLPQMTM